jgi:hypothetical protein
MEGRVTGPFSEVLARGREQFNTKFAYARRLNRRLQPEAFMDHLASVVAPIVNKAADNGPVDVDEIGTVLYDLSLDLFAQGCFGQNGRYPVVSQAWEKLLPAAIHLVAQAPRRVVASISNALFSISAQKGAQEQDWLKIMGALPGQCHDIESFLQAGVVAAWRCGMAHYREGALQICESLPPAVFARIFGLELELDESGKDRVLKHLESDHWYDPLYKPPPAPGGKRAGLRIVAIPGGFRGFGGPFVTPPRVKIIDGQIFLWDAEHHYNLHADIFGTNLIRAGSGPPSGSSATNRLFHIDSTGVIKKDDFVNYFEELAKPSSSASTLDTLVVCLAHSHYAYLVARPNGGENGPA